MVLKSLGRSYQGELKDFEAIANAIVGLRPNTVGEATKKLA